MASVATAAFLGVEGHEVSALYLINYIKSGYGLKIMVSDGKDGAQYIRAQQGENEGFFPRVNIANIEELSYNRHAIYIKRSC